MPTLRFATSTPERTASAPPIGFVGSLGGRTRGGRATPWLIGAVIVLVPAVVFVVLSGVRPAFDAYGWLVWGHQALRWDLSTNSAPSWKPLTFMFTFPYALAGRGALWLWMVTATAGAMAAPIPAARVAYRLAGAGAGRRFGALAGAAFAGVAVIGLAGYSHFMMIATADPLLVTLTLGAIDCHLSGRPRGAFALLVLVALGRPEAWPFAGAYAAWAWRAVPGSRRLLAAGIVLIPVAWFTVPALTSHSWFGAGDTALIASTPLHGNKLTGVIHNFFSLYELPMQLAALGALGLAVVRRERAWLLLAAGAVAWVAIWVGFALHGWEPDPRYMFEAAAVEVVLVGAAIGSILAFPPPGRAWRWLSAAAVVAVLAALGPVVADRVQAAETGVTLGQTWARQIDRLGAVIARDGGARRILACGRAVTTVPYQTILAWHLGENIHNVGWLPGKMIRSGQPIVFFKPVAAGWKVQPIHVRRAACRRLRRHTAYTL